MVDVGDKDGEAWTLLGIGNVRSAQEIDHRH